MRLSIVAAALCLSIAGLSLADDVHASIRAKTNIPAQGLGPALKLLAKDRNFQVIYVSEQINSLHTEGAVGELTPEEALRALLKGTGMTYLYLNERTVTILPSSSGAVMPNASESPWGGTDGDKSDSEEKSSSQSFRMAQVDQGAPTSASSVEKQDRQNSDQNSVKLEEVVVTAQKREERLIDVPVSIVALSGDELQQRKITSVENLASVVPSLSYANGGGSIHYFEIRGISNGTGTSSQIGLYIDEADVTLGGGFGSPQIDVNIYDLARAEVLRGPQGTLYGEGSAGGTIRLITKDPNLTRFTFDSDVAALWTQDGSPSQRVSAVANIPLIDSQLGLRVTGTFNHEGGWIDQSAADLKDINGQDLTNVRAKVLWQPIAQFKVSAMAILNRADRGVDVSDPTAPNNYTQVFHLTTTPRVQNNWDLYHLSLTYDFPSARLVSATSYLKFEAPWFNQGFYYYFEQPPSQQSDYYAPFQKTADYAITDELRLTSLGSSVWQWTIGAFYRHYQDAIIVPLQYFAALGPSGTPLPEPYPSSLFFRYKQASVFADSSYTLWNRFTVGAGVRYFHDDQQYDDYVALTQKAAQFHSVDPRIYAQFKLAPTANLYASAAKGFRSGGFNFNVAYPAFGPESVWTYELGAKTTFLEGRVSADTAVFMTNYSDYQTSGNFSFNTDDPQFYNANIGKARIKGIEADLALRPLPNWRFDLRGDYLNARFVEINATGTGYVVGDPLDNVPRYQLVSTVQRDFSWNDRSGFIQLDYRRTGSTTARNRSVGPWYYGESDTINMLNFNTSLFFGNKFRLGFFAQNLLNDNGYVNPFSFFGAQVRSRPRTYGVDFGVTLE